MSTKDPLDDLKRIRVAVDVLIADHNKYKKFYDKFFDAFDNASGQPDFLAAVYALAKEARPEPKT